MNCTRMSITLCCLLVLLITVFQSLTQASTPESNISAEQALEWLKAGNQRFAETHREYPHLTKEQMDDTAKKGQHPFVTMITCSDSRVPAEHIFDQGIGDMFIIRVAGNVCDTDEIGSIEYGVDHLGTPLLVVLGHSQCGAVTAVVQDAELHGSIPPLVDNIGPAVKTIKKHHPDLNDDELISASIQANVWQSIEDLLKRSEATRERVRSGKLKVIGAVYQIDNGKVEWMGEHPRQQDLLEDQKSSQKESNIHTNPADSGQSFIHVVYFWLKEGTSIERKQQLIQDCKDYLGSIETVQKIYVGTPAGTPREDVDNTWAVNLVIFFNNKEEHDFYQQAEAHLKFIERNQEIWERVQVYDTIAE